jgi:hypothetical protein
MSVPIILDNKEPDAPSVFEPAALLREARRQKRLSLADVPALCILDPDGDIVRRLRNSGQAKLSDKWPCYHTDLYEFAAADRHKGSDYDLYQGSERVLRLPREIHSLKELKR